MGDPHVVRSVFARKSTRANRTTIESLRFLPVPCFGVRRTHAIDFYRLVS